jgi:hypothetical protein
MPGFGSRWTALVIKTSNGIRTEPFRPSQLCDSSNIQLNIKSESDSSSGSGFIVTRPRSLRSVCDDLSAAKGGRVTKFSLFFSATKQPSEPEDGKEANYR